MSGKDFSHTAFMKAFAFALLLCAATGVEAGWTVIGQLPPLPNGRPRPISSGFFWDARHGLVGTGIGWVSNAQNSPPPAIFYCKDGKTWVESNHPVGVKGEEVTTILMTDSLRGYATLLNTMGGDTYGLWATGDGGLSWTADPSIPSSATQVYFAPDGSRHIIMFNGAQGPNLSGLSIAWMSPSVGVITTGGANGLPRGVQWTTNGGANWSPIIPGIRAYGVYASKRTQTFFIGPEETNNNVDAGPMLSNDSGRTWHQSGVWPADQYGYWKPMGDIRGGRDVVYVQSTVSTMNGFNYPGPRGLLRTTDNGITWTNIGGPSNTLDTRFTTAGCRGAIVIAYDDQGHIWSSDDAGDGAVREDDARPWLTAVTLDLSATLCGETRGGVRVWNDHCDSMRIDSIAFVDASLSSAGALSFDPLPALPRTFATDASDSIGVVWRPRAAFNRDTVVWTDVRIRFYSSTTRTSRDTILHLHLSVTSESARYTLSADSIDAGNRSVCDVVDTTLDVVNMGCDTLWIDGASASGGWQSDSVFPIALPPSATGQIALHDRGIVLGASLDSLRIVIRFQGRRDTSLVRLHVTGLHGGSAAVWTNRVLDFGTLALCGPNDTLDFILKNAGCDTLVVTNTGGWSGAAFRWIAGPGMQTIPPGAVVHLRVVFEPLSPGDFAAAANITLLHADGIVEQVLLNTIGKVSDGVGSMSIRPHDADFGMRTICMNPDTAWIVVRNTGCDTLMFDNCEPWHCALFGMIWPAAVNPLGPGDTMTFGVVFMPSMPGVYTDSVRVTLRHANSSQLKDVFTARGIVADSGRRALAVNRDTLAFGSVAPCAGRDSLIILRNAGCDTLHVTACSASDSAFGVAQGQLPIAIPPGESRPLVVTYRPGGPGTNAGFIDITSDDVAAHRVALTGASRGAVQMILTTVGSMEHVKSGEKRMILLSLEGPAPEAPVTTVEVRLHFDPEMFHATGAQAMQGELRSFSAGIDTATVVLGFSGTPDSSRPIAGIELLALVNPHDSCIIGITRASIGVASANPASCYLTFQTFGTTGSTTLCGPPESRNVTFTSFSLRAWPSPADGYISFETRAPSPGTIEITDMLGRVVGRMDVAGVPSLTTIPTHAWQPGMYSALLRVGDVAIRQGVWVVR